MMHLKEYVDAEMKRTASNRTAVLTKLAETSGVSMMTLRSVYQGMSVSTVDTARAISKATAGKVRVFRLLGLKEGE
jgi:hypothetical protein